jgi:hypothetical protein
MLQSSPLKSNKKRWELKAIFEINWNREKALNAEFYIQKLKSPQEMDQLLKLATASQKLSKREKKSLKSYKFISNPSKLRGRLVGLIHLNVNFFYFTFTIRLG